MSKRFIENAFRILKSVYYMEKPKNITKEIKKNMSDQEFAEVMVFLERKGLINVKNLEKEGPFHINLTDKGVEFVVNELNRKNQVEFNRIVAFTGAILALIGIYNFILGNFSFEKHPSNLLAIKIIFLFLLIVCISPLVKIIIDNIFRRK